MSRGFSEVETEGRLRTGCGCLPILAAFVAPFLERFLYGRGGLSGFWSVIFAITMVFVFSLIYFALCAFEDKWREKHEESQEERPPK